MPKRGKDAAPNQSDLPAELVSHLLAACKQGKFPVRQISWMDYEDHYQVLVVISKVGMEVQEVQRRSVMTRCDLEVLRLVQQCQKRMTTSRLLAYASQQHCRYSDGAIKRSLAKLVSLGKITNDPHQNPPGYSISR